MIPVNKPTASPIGRAPTAAPIVRTIGRVSVPAPISLPRPVPISPAVLSSAAIKASATLSQSPSALIQALPVSKSIMPAATVAAGMTSSAISASKGMTTGPYSGTAGTGITSGPTASSGGGGNYDVPYTEPDRPYVPPPRENDLPSQYDSSKLDTPALTNADPNSAKSAAIAILPTLPPVAAKPGIIDRILSFLGLSRTKVLQAKLSGEAAALATMSRTDAAYSLVRRARNGDQNAMALIAAVRDRAMSGDKQAEVSVRLMHAYINAHPNDENADMGAEEEDDTSISAAVELSHGPTLTNSRIFNMTHHLSNFEKGAFAHGMRGGPLKDNQNPRVEASHKLGKVVGAARVMQAARMPHVPLSRINADVGWELE